MENNYNDLNKFKATKKNVRKKIEGNVLIPIYYYIDDDGTVHIDTRSMEIEFQRTVYGIESVLEDLQQ
jgi:hypothetical protein